MPDPAEGARHGYRDILRATRTLLDLRKSKIVPGILGAQSAGAEILADRAVRASWELGNGAILTIESNFGNAPVAVQPVSGLLIHSSDPSAEADVLEGLTTRAFLA